MACRKTTLCSRYRISCLVMQPLTRVAIWCMTVPSIPIARHVLLSVIVSIGNGLPVLRVHKACQPSQSLGMVSHRHSGANTLFYTCASMGFCRVQPHHFDGNWSGGVDVSATVIKVMSLHSANACSSTGADKSMIVVDAEDMCALVQTIKHKLQLLVRSEGVLKYGPSIT